MGEQIFWSTAKNGEIEVEFLCIHDSGKWLYIDANYQCVDYKLKVIVPLASHMGVALPECNYGAHSCKSHTGAAQMVWHNWCFSGEKASVIPLCIMSEECVLADSAPHHWNLDRKYAGFHPFINPEHNCNNKEQDWYDNFVSQNSRSLCQGWPSCLLGQCQITPTLCTCSPTPTHWETCSGTEEVWPHLFMKYIIRPSRTF